MVSRHGQHGVPPLARGGVRRRAALRRCCGRARGAVRADSKALSPLEARRPACGQLLVAACRGHVQTRPRQRRVSRKARTRRRGRAAAGRASSSGRHTWSAVSRDAARDAAEMRPRCGRGVQQPPAAVRSAPRRRWARCSLQAAAARLSCRRRLARLQVLAAVIGDTVGLGLTRTCVELPHCCHRCVARRPNAPSPPWERRLAAASRRGGGGRGAGVHARVRAASGRCWRAQADSGGELGRGCRGCGQGGYGLRGGGAARLGGGLLPRP